MFGATCHDSGLRRAATLLYCISCQEVGICCPSPEESFLGVESKMNNRHVASCPVLLRALPCLQLATCDNIDATIRARIQHHLQSAAPPVKTADATAAMATIPVETELQAVQLLPGNEAATEMPAVTAAKAGSSIGSAFAVANTDLLSAALASAATVVSLVAGDSTHVATACEARQQT